MQLKNVIISISLLALSGVVSVKAEDTDAKKEPVAPQKMSQQQIAKKQAVLQKANKLRVKLAQVQEKVLKEDKDLKQQQENLNEQYSEISAKAGYTKEKKQRFVEIQKELQKSSPEDANTKKLQEEYKKHQQSYIRARMAAQNDTELQTEQKAFQDDLLAAMVKEEPKVKNWISQLSSINKSAVQR